MTKTFLKCLSQTQTYTNTRLGVVQLLLVTTGKEKIKNYFKKEQHALAWGQCFKAVTEPPGVFMFIIVLQHQGSAKFQSWNAPQRRKRTHRNGAANHPSAV